MSIDSIKTVAVLGAGTMGNGIAHVFARSGYKVLLRDVEQRFLDRALDSIAKNLDREIKKGKLSEAEKGTVLARLLPVTDMSTLANADFVVEAVPEKIELKRHVLTEADHLVRDDVIIASNTSSIAITTLAALTKRPDRFVGMHFMNPVPVMVLVEVIRALQTSDATFATTMQLAERLGKKPVAVNDAPGFVSNRVLMPLINEAAYCVMEGVATPEARGHSRSGRRGDENRHEPSHGTAGASRFHRPGRLRRHHARPPRRPRRPQIPRLPPAEEIRRGRLARTQILSRFLHLPCLTRPASWNP